MILGLPWIEAHGVVLDLHQRRLLFKENVCTYTGALPASQKVACMSWDEAQAIRPAISPEQLDVQLKPPPIQPESNPKDGPTLPTIILRRPAPNKKSTTNV